ncbi:MULTISPECIES: pirin family protein [unclassified Caballeronia]|uniref:pirin family protein n=1 Tax=unclassified Caballeronia TaxID=2646786 RepID=UPI002028A485|nr:MULTISPECIES: pirin family protein [unclassified Caballeronia]MDR5772431.1 pirin family protein [Caballeronia sp. LZ002]MDR5847865.1 pirin family protein [Caballeronia sp. LZ003]
MSTSIRVLLKPHQHDVGGLTVRRVLPALAARTVGPFIFFDHIGPATLVPGQGLDVRPHPHIGLATVTYLFEGAIMHRDSVDSVQKIVPGDVNWMTAGRGIVHSERTPDEERERGQTMHGIQTWVALPVASEEVEPSFEHHAASALPQIERDGVTLRVIAGTAFGAQAPTRTFSPTLYVAADFARGSALTLDTEHEERGVYLVEGDLSIDGQALPEQQMAVLEPGAPVRFESTNGARVMILGGAPLDGARIIEWNFVASSRDKIEAAKQAWSEQRMGHVPGETEFIPLPPARRENRAPEA